MFQLVPIYSDALIRHHGRWRDSCGSHVSSEPMWFPNFAANQVASFWGPNHPWNKWVLGQAPLFSIVFFSLFSWSYPKPSYQIKVFLRHPKKERSLRPSWKCWLTFKTTPEQRWCFFAPNTPQKSNIETKNCHVLRELPFPTIILGIHVSFRGCRWL